MQVRIADLGVTLPKLGPDLREQTGRGHEDLRGVGDLGARLRLPVWRSNNRYQTAATQSPKAVG
jgi:hypothetical protein